MELIDREAMRDDIERCCNDSCGLYSGPCCGVCGLIQKAPVVDAAPLSVEKMKVRLETWAKMPTRAHKEDAGLDLYSPRSVDIYPRDSVVIDTGVHLAIPEGWVGDVKSKSGLMMVHDIITDGTVDAGYTGSIRVKLFNLGEFLVPIEKGQKIAQIVIKKIITPELEVVESLEETERGDGGFGSTGKF